jgi:hypothetical protein
MPGTTLADWLRALDDTALAALLRARPDDAPEALRRRLELLAQARALGVLAAPLDEARPRREQRLVDHLDALVGDEEVWVQVTRGEADRLGLQPGAEVHLRAVNGAGVMASTHVRAD